MNEFIEKLIGRLEEAGNYHLQLSEENKIDVRESNRHKSFAGVYGNAISIVNELAEEYKLFGNSEQVNGGWISCSEKLPPVETEVWIVAKRKWKDGTCKYITTTAMYEDGTVLENDSCWRWEDIEGEWNEEEDCYIIPEGWWENKHYNADGELNHAVDDEVIAWQPLPDPYIEK